eukprot:804957-Rhodomonas_salina.1
MKRKVARARSARREEMCSSERTTARSRRSHAHDTSLPNIHTHPPQRSPVPCCAVPCSAAQRAKPRAKSAEQ